MGGYNENEKWVKPCKNPCKILWLYFRPHEIPPHKNIIHKYKPRVSDADQEHTNTRWQVWRSYFLISTALCSLSSLSKAFIQSSYSSDTSRLPGSSFRKFCSKQKVHSGETDRNDLTNLAAKCCCQDLKIKCLLKSYTCICQYIYWPICKIHSNITLDKGTYMSYISM